MSRQGNGLKMRRWNYFFFKNGHIANLIENFCAWQAHKLWFFRLWTNLMELPCSDAKTDNFQSRGCQISFYFEEYWPFKVIHHGCMVLPICAACILVVQKLGIWVVQILSHFCENLFLHFTRLKQVCLMSSDVICRYSKILGWLCCNETFESDCDQILFQVSFLYLRWLSSLVSSLCLIVSSLCLISVPWYAASLFCLISVL